MSKLERIIIALVAGCVCPVLTFTFFWWTAAAIHLHLVSLPTSAIITSAFTGLGLGVLLDVFLLRTWVDAFYAARLSRMLAVYLALFVVAFGFCMGFPLGTFLLGTFAGAYIGRREHHRRSDRKLLRTTLGRTATLTSSLTALAALPMGILGLKEQIVATVFENCFGLGRQWLQGAAGYSLVGLFCVLLFAAQHWCSRKAGFLAFGFSSDTAPPARTAGH